MELDIEKFSPTRAELASLVEKAKTIDLVNPFDDLQLSRVKEARDGLRSTRTAITRRGKELREDALAFQRAVIATERDLVAIIEPEEERLATLIEAATEMREREARRDVLPRRMERLATIGDQVAVTDDDVLNMDGPTFEGYFNRRQAEHNEDIRLANEAKERELHAEEERQEREREAQEREERARKEEREERMKAEQEARAKEERTRRAEEEAKERERNERFQQFLAERGWTKEFEKDFLIEPHTSTGEIVLWKKVGVFKQTITE